MNQHGTGESKSDMKPSDHGDDVAKISSLICSLLPKESGENIFAERYARCIEGAADLDDLSWVRDGRIAERFEAEFMGFASAFAQDAVVEFARGDHVSVSVGFARFDRKLRKAVLLAWANKIRARTERVD